MEVQVFLLDQKRLARSNRQRERLDLLNPETMEGALIKLRADGYYRKSYVIDAAGTISTGSALQAIKSLSVSQDNVEGSRRIAYGDIASIAGQSLCYTSKGFVPFSQTLMRGGN